MSMHTRVLGGSPGARRSRGRFAIALIGALALTLGPGAIAAQAAAPVPDETVAATAAPQAEPDQAPAADPVVPDPLVPPPAQEPVVPEPVVPDPVVVPPPPDPVVPEPVVPDPVVPDPVVAPPEQQPVVPDPVVPDPVVPDPDPAVDEPATEPEPAAEESEAPDPEAGATADAPAAAAKPAVEDGKNGNANPKVKVRICHATGTDKYVVLWPNANGDVSGHAGHQGGRDIIPSFVYNDGGEPATFPGQNMDAEGTAIYENGCVAPDPEEPEPGTPVITLTPPECIAEGEQAPTSVAVTVSGLTGEGESAFELSIENGSGWSASEPVLGNGVYALPLNGPGEYRVEISGADGVLDWTSFTLDDCGAPPEPVSFCHIGDVGQLLELPAAEVFTQHLGVDSADIIPPFDYEGTTYSQNWDADGIATFERGCAEEPEPEAPTIGVTAPECLAVDSDESGSATVLVSGETAGGYTVTVSNESGWSASAGVPAGTDVSVMIALPGPGVYTATLRLGETTVDSAQFTVDECDVPPEPPGPATVSVAVDQCTVPGGEPAGTATVTLGDLVVGTTYRVRVLSGDAEASSRLVVAAGTTAVVGLTGLVPGSYTVRVDAASDGPVEGEPWSVDAVFAVNACPPVVAPPERPEPPAPPRQAEPPEQQTRVQQAHPVAQPALAVTGAEDSGWIAGVGLMLILAGTATVLAMRRRA